MTIFTNMAVENDGRLVSDHLDKLTQTYLVGRSFLPKKHSIYMGLTRKWEEEILLKEHLPLPSDNRIDFD